MRILCVRFKNLNSLAGEWQVDFTHPAYASDGIFAITGPTGAGKTTIMDAVCLALYGSTPRLSRVTKGGNEIMSRQTGECSAEVTFETGKGRYRCHWSQHRARKHPDGELQQARHEIADADTGQVLESKLNQVGEFIEKVTGMDFGRFTRSMLLAQGGFAVFLQASPNERSPILEQITGTEIYSQISVQVHERRAAELEKLELLQAELKGIRVLGEEEEKEQLSRLGEKQGQEAELARKMKETARALAWIEGMAALEKELQELEKKQQAFEERRQDFARDAGRLEKAKKALGLEGDYRSLTDLRALQTREMTELQGALAGLPEKERAGSSAVAARSVAEELLSEARTRQATEGEVIKKVRDLDVRLDEQRKQLVEKNRAIGEIEKQARGHQSRIQGNGQELETLLAAREALEQYRTAHAVDALLATHFGVIERGFAGLQVIAEKDAKARDALSQVAGKKESALSECARCENAHQGARLAFEKQESDLKALTDEIAALLRGRDIGQWRAETDALKERERLLVQTGEAVARIDRTSALLEGLKTDREELMARLVAVLEEAQSCGVRKTGLEKEIAGLETQVALLSRIRDLEAERKRLEDGRPCPLCGAIDHPYAKGNLPILDEAEAELKKCKTEFRKVSDRLAELEARRVKTAAEIGHIEKETTEKNAGLEADQTQCADALSRLNLEVPLAERAARIGEALAGILATITETTQMIARAEEKGRQEKSARALLEKTGKTLGTAEKGLVEARHKKETTGLDHERLTRESAALSDEAAATRAALLADLGPFGIDAIPPDGIDSLLQDLTVRKALWQDKEAEKTVLVKKIDGLKAGMERDRALLASQETDLARRRKERDGLKEAQDALSASRRELFGEKSADEEEKRLAAAVDQAVGELEKAREAQSLVEREISSLKEKIASLRAKTTHRATELDGAERAMRLRIQSAGFVGEADYLTSRLTEAEREALADKETNLLREKTELESRRKDRAESLASEREKKLTDQSAETVAERIRAFDAELKQLQLDIGGIHQILSDNEAQKGSQAERLKAIDFQKTEWSRWDELHQLIGSADGKKFRNFAQGLTFEMMTRHANHRLSEMSDRYLLIRDAVEPLELNVIDNYQAGEIRSTKNLSGGESFIVSLALALGLSQMASKNVRVDSLFLDEGFGTLDEEALETALETLAGLRRDGKLIGVISHVAALKERIATRIQVIPGSGGRSTLAGPGCRRVCGD